jgi:hypothetical protein
MCDFFSIVSDGKGKAYYFDWKIRKQILAGKLNYEHDSHTSIADYYGFSGKKEDKLNKFEFNPITKEFKTDQLNVTDDSEKIKKLCMSLDWKSIIPCLVVKPIFQPFSVEANKITNKHKKLLLKWNSVGDSVRASAWDSVGDSVRASVRASVGNSVWASVRASVGDSVWDSVGDSVRASVVDSVRDSVYAYIGSFFKLPRNKWKCTEGVKCVGYPLKPLVDLWMSGLVPVWNGRKWSLYGKRDGKVVKLYEQ